MTVDALATPATPATPTINPQQGPLHGDSRNNSPMTRQGPDVMASEQAVEARGTPRPALPLSVLLQVAGVLSAIAVTYSTMVANDREHATAIAQLQRDVARIEKDTKDLKVEILGELREIRNELRERQKGR